MNRHSLQKSLPAILMVSFLALGSSCKKPSAESLAKYGSSQKNETENQKPTGGIVAQQSASPLLKTDPKCEDHLTGDDGHSPGPGMNHCPPMEANASAGNAKEAKAQNQEPIAKTGL